MLETLKIGDHILVNKFIYGTKIPFTDTRILPIRKPKRLDIIVFKFPEDEKKDFIKRIIGEPGDTLEIRDKVIYINKKPLTENYTIHTDHSLFPADLQPRDNLGPVIIPKESYFVMGDNRDQSLDSRFWGMVDSRKIKGKAFMIYWSWDSDETWMRWWRIGKFTS